MWILSTGNKYAYKHLNNTSSKIFCPSGGRYYTSTLTNRYKYYKINKIKVRIPKHYGIIHFTINLKN